MFSHKNVRNSLFPYIHTTYQNTCIKNIFIWNILRKIFMHIVYSSESFIMTTTMMMMLMLWCCGFKIFLVIILLFHNRRVFIKILHSTFINLAFIQQEIKICLFCWESFEYFFNVCAHVSFNILLYLCFQKNMLSLHKLDEISVKLFNIL